MEKVARKVYLVVPEAIIDKYNNGIRTSFTTLASFIGIVEDRQNNFY
jgi:hypothetical protein